MDKNRKDTYSAALIAFLASGVLLALMPYFSVVMLPAVLIVVPMFQIYAITQSGYTVGGAAAVASFAVLCFINAQLYGLLALMLLPFVFAAVYALRGKKRLLHSVAISAFAALAGVVLVIGVLQVTSGMGIVDLAVDRLGQMLARFSEAEISYLYQMARITDLMSGAVTMEALQATPADTAIAFMQEMVRDGLNLLLVLVVIIYAMLMGLVVYLIARAYAKKRGFEAAGIPRFSDFALPRRFWLAAIISTLAAMIGENLGWASFDLLFVTIYYAYAFVFTVQALSLLDFLYVSRNMSKGVRIVLHIVALLLLGNLLMWVGLIENAFGVRKRLKERWDAK